jgi:hypothetical protein
LWQEYAHGLNGQEPLREKERRGSNWRREPIDPKTGKRGFALQNFWYTRRPIYLFIEMRIVVGDRQAVAVETYQEIVNHYLTKNGFTNWIVLSPLLRGVLDQEKNAVTTCQQIFNKYLTRNGRPITVIIGDQVQNKEFERSLGQSCSKGDAAADAGIQELERELHVLEEELKNENQLLWEEDEKLYDDAAHKTTREATARASGTHRS